jgi:hypothetical protein
VDQPVGEAHRRAGRLGPRLRFVRGLEPTAGSGVVRDNLRSSDHRPVWAELRRRL